MGNLDEPALSALASLLRVRHTIDDEIGSLIGQTPSLGHIGEAVAAAIFDIELAPSGVNPGFDGVFRSGPLVNRTVNVKTYSERSGLLDVSPHPSDFYLVFVGPARTRKERGRALPFKIERVFVFDTSKLKDALKLTGVAVGIATSVRKEEWEKAAIYPKEAVEAPLAPDERQRYLLAMFAG